MTPQSWNFFYDFHTMPTCPDVGANFDAEALVSRIAAVGGTAITFAAKCNLGMCYYPSRVGTPHPSMRQDLLGNVVTAARRHGLQTMAYVNAGLSHQQALAHMEWLRLAPDGQVYLPDRLNNFFRFMCRNTEYAEWLLALIAEVLTDYSVDGLFLDCLLTIPCICPACIRDMKAQCRNWQDPEEQFQFARERNLAFCRQVRELVKHLRPGMELFFNGIEYEDLPELATYIEFECLPNGGWGYDQLPMYGHYLRNIGLPVCNMTARFHRSWSDFGGIRPQADLLRDVLTGLSYGMEGTSLADHLHPRGNVAPVIMQRFQHVLAATQPLRPYLEGARPLADTALLVPRFAFNASHPDSRSAFQCVRGATRMLEELRIQFDTVTESMSLEGYAVVIVTDAVRISPALREKLQRHLARNGKIIGAGRGGLNPGETDFAMPEWGLSYRGTVPHEPLYLDVPPEWLPEYRDLPLALYSHACAVECVGDTTVAATLTASYYDRGWDGEHGYVYNPPAQRLSNPGVTRNAQVIYCAAPIFSTYADCAYVPFRELLGKFLTEWLPRPLLQCGPVPSFLRVQLTEQQTPPRRMIHLTAFVPERRGSEGIEVIEEGLAVAGFELKLHTGGRRPLRVFDAGSKTAVAWKDDDNYSSIQVPPFTGHALLVVELQPIAKEVRHCHYTSP